MPFFKKQDQNLITAEIIEGQGYVLSELGKDDYTYPVDGWYWFPDLDTAISRINNPTATVVTNRQARLALLQAGLLDTVNTTISTLGSPDAHAIQIEWEYASEIRRDSPLVVGLGGMLGLTEVQISELFELASTL
jgi:hypothetical protein